MVRLILFLFALSAPVFAQEQLPADKARLRVILDQLETPPVEGQMLLATVRGDYRVTIALQDLTVPRTRSFDWVQLERDQWTMEQVDGFPTQVMRRRIAIFPQRAGDLVFPTLGHKLTVVTPGGGRAEHIVESEPVEVSVRPAHGQPWLPVSEIEFSDEWNKDPGALPMGETVQRRVVIRALGATAKMLPEQPEIRAPWLISFASPEKRTTELTPLGPLTTVVWEWSLRPKTGEKGVIPDIQFPYFDTASQSAGALVLKAAPVGYEAAPDALKPSPWRSDFTAFWYPALGLALGMLTPWLVTGSDSRLRSRAELSRILGRFRPDPARLRLARAARRGDARAMRQAAADLAAKLAPDRAAVIREMLAPLDRQLFGPNVTTSTPLRSLARRILAFTRSTSRAPSTGAYAKES